MCGGMHSRCICDHAYVVKIKEVLNAGKKLSLAISVRVIKAGIEWLRRRCKGNFVPRFILNCHPCTFTLQGKHHMEFSCVCKPRKVIKAIKIVADDRSVLKLLTTNSCV